MPSCLGCSRLLTGVVEQNSVVVLYLMNVIRPNTLFRFVYFFVLEMCQTCSLVLCSFAGAHFSLNIMHNVHNTS